MNSKRKGCAGERKFAALCRQHEIEDAQRGQQFAAGIDSPDVKDVLGNMLR